MNFISQQNHLSLDNNVHLCHTKKKKEKKKDLTQGEEETHFVQVTMTRQAREQAQLHGFAGAAGSAMPWQGRGGCGAARTGKAVWCQGVTRQNLGLSSTWPGLPNSWHTTSKVTPNRFYLGK